STRPFAKPVAVAEELQRVIPAIRKIRRKSGTPISIDTTKAIVAREAIDAGATMINDISALRQDPEMIEVVKSFEGQVVIMHMQGTPGDMQLDPHYGDVIAEINSFFAERIEWLEHCGVERSRIIVDPGIGFGKILEHNLAILRNISSFKGHGCPVLIGHSRKSFLGQLLELPVEERDWPTALASAFVEKGGADIIRVHQVGVTIKALRLMRELEGEGEGV
ncbi:MAG: dihydropteroate synthase, partial [Desulfobulbus sp.]